MSLNPQQEKILKAFVTALLNKMNLCHWHYKSSSMQSVRTWKLGL
jgi:hypothetical protein